MSKDKTEEEVKPAVDQPVEMDDMEKLYEAEVVNLQKANTELEPLLKHRAELEKKLEPLKGELYELNQRIKPLMAKKGKAEARVPVLAKALGKDKEQAAPEKRHLHMKAETGKIGVKFQS